MVCVFVLRITYSPQPTEYALLLTLALLPFPWLRRLLAADLHQLNLRLVALALNLQLAVGEEALRASLEVLRGQSHDSQDFALVRFEFGDDDHRDSCIGAKHPPKAIGYAQVLWANASSFLSL